MFFYTKNLTTLSVSSDVLPWDFKPAAEVSAQVRHEKKARQAFYQNAATEHYFYSTLEGSNPNMRVSKENPPRAIHALAADYDIRIPAERVAEAISAMRIKPSWTERSLGGNVRLVWLFPRPIYTDGYDFTSFMLKVAIKWLNLELLPGLDESAFTTPTRLLCNGCDWTNTGHPEISEAELQAFFVSCGKQFRFKGPDGPSIPLDVVEAELKKHYPSFNWPNDFTPDTQGPTFWVPESTSPLSAILKAEGFITFSAHAVKPFYSWADILGPEFIRQFATESISKATKDIWWDGKRFWRRKGETYVSLETPELSNYFRVECKLSAKPNPGEGISPIDLALSHIYNEGHVLGAAPFVFRPPGLLSFMGKRVLNTYVNRVQQPVSGAAAWPANFPFLASLLDNLFDPPHQLPHFLAWWKHYYQAGLSNTPMPGPNIFLMGGADVGKTFLNRVVVGRSVGGHVDASEFLIRGGAFNSELFEAPLWCVDDETAGESDVTRNNFQAMLKKSTANQTHRHNKKFEVPVMTEWMGRIICTTNLDYVSSRLLGSMDNTSQDKTSLFRCASKSKIVFPPRYELQKIVESELPYFLRWLLDWDPPAEVKRHVRFGYESFHEASLLDQSAQGGKSAPFKEVLIEALQQWFEDNKEAKQWEGTTTQIVRMLHSNPLNEMVLRTMRLEQTSRYLEAIQREGLIPCRVDTGKLKQRIWVFDRI